MAIIDYDEINQPIKDIECILSQFDNEEKALILKFVNGRFNELNNKARVQNSLADLKFGGIFKKLMKQKEGEEEDGI